MKTDYEKTALAAFILSLLGLVTFGLAVIPALVCAVISKRQAQLAGAKVDGFATAAFVVSCFVLGLWALGLLLGASVLGLSSGGFRLPPIGMEELRMMLIATGALILAVVGAKWISHANRQRRMRRLAGR